MSKEVTVPELGENIETADVTAILVKAGDTVTAEQPLIEVESDKASVEVPAPFAGVVDELRIKEGQKIKVGQVILTLKADGDGAGAADEAKAEKAEEKTPAAPAPEPSAPAASSAPAATPAAAAPSSAPSPAKQAPRLDPGEPVPAAPSVRRLARELGADIRRVTGTGPGGRISMKDVKTYVKDVVERRIGATPSASTTGLPSLPDFEQFGPIRREHMKGIRRRTAEKMVQSWSNIPHVTQFDEADVTALEAYRRGKAGKLVERAGGKLTVTAMLIKVTAMALKKFPQFNTSVDIEHDEIIYKDYVHIGVAVDTDRGLLVPVIRDTDKKGITEISIALNSLGERARARKTKPDELQGGTFSVTNLGGLGTTHFTPIINWPEVAVLGVGRANQRAFLIDGEWQAKLILPLSISYDHRIIDGADAARFLRWICEVLENPINLIM